MSDEIYDNSSYDADPYSRNNDFRNQEFQEEQNEVHKKYLDNIKKIVREQTAKFSNMKKNKEEKLNEVKLPEFHTINPAEEIEKLKNSDVYFHSNSNIGNIINSTYDVKNYDSAKRIEIEKEEYLKYYNSFNVKSNIPLNYGVYDVPRIFKEKPVKKQIYPDPNMDNLITTLTSSENIDNFIADVTQKTVEDDFAIYLNKKTVKKSIDVHAVFDELNQKLNTEYKFLAEFSLKSRKTYYIKCPKTFKGDFKEAYQLAKQGTNNFNCVDKLPFSNKVKQIPSKYPPFINKNKVRVNPNFITRKEFLLKNNKFFNVRIGNHLENRTITSSGRFLNTISGKSCAKNIILLYNNGINCYVGITTGVYIVEEGSIEIIGYESLNNGSYSDKSKFKKIVINVDHIRHIFDNFSEVGQNFFRLKVINIENSTALFGFKQAKLKMLNKTYVPTDYNIIKGYFSRKLAKEIDIVEILSEEGKKLKFLLDDIDFYTINTNFSLATGTISKLIQLGSKVKIKDNRKTKFEKNQHVVVTNIRKDKSNFKNSLVTVLDDIGIKSLVFLKQLKVVL